MCLAKPSYNYELLSDRMGCCVWRRVGWSRNLLFLKLRNLYQSQSITTCFVCVFTCIYLSNSLTCVMGFDTVIKQLHKFAIIFSFFFPPEVHVCLRSCIKNSHLQWITNSTPRTFVKSPLHYCFSTSVLSGFFLYCDETCVWYITYFVILFYFFIFLFMVVVVVLLLSLLLLFKGEAIRQWTLLVTAHLPVCCYIPQRLI